MKKALILFCMVLVSTVALAENKPADESAEAPKAQLAVQVSDPSVDALVDSWQPQFAIQAEKMARDQVAQGARLVNFQQKAGGASRMACPAVTQCAGPNCNPGPCQVVDTGWQGCTQGPLGRLCPAGQTVHIMTCQCSCPGPFCSVQCPSSQQQSWSCL